MELRDQVAIVTGAGRGIGKAIALRLAREGADIAAVDVDPDTATATADEIRELGRRAFVRTADVSNPEDVANAVTEIVEELGRVDILVNNAGIETRASFFEITPRDCITGVTLSVDGGAVAAGAYMVEKYRRRKAAAAGDA
jgi:meso-butanediol dehydrogenase/(S,S)-butanediol dehydrogenase/diacetyl reductase